MNNSKLIVKLEFKGKEELQQLIAQIGKKYDIPVDIDISTVKLGVFKITEWFDKNTGYLTIRRPNYSNYDVDITIEALDGKTEEFDTTITFNGKTLKDIIKFGELNVPELVMNFADEVSTVQTSLSIAAFNERLAGILTIEAYKQQEELGYRNIVWHVINTIIAIVAGALAGSVIVAIVVHAVSMLLIPSELH